MTKLFSVLIFVGLLCTNCRVYNVVEAKELTYGFVTTDTTTRILYQISEGEEYLIKNKAKGFYYARYHDYNGFVHRPGYKSLHKKRWVFGGGGYRLPRKPLENNRFYEDSSPSYDTGDGSGAGSGYDSGKTVHVKGYHRKDGTYVRPHTRSAPRRR